MKLTEKDFKLFKEECTIWVDRLGLFEWDIKYGFDGKEDQAGSCFINYTASQATIKLAKDFIDGDLIDKKAFIKETAKHEVIELLLMPLNILAEGRVWDAGEWERNRHMIVQRLMKTI